MHRVFGHKEWKIFVECKSLVLRSCRICNFFMLEGCDKIKADEMDETNVCAGSGEE